MLEDGRPGLIAALAALIGEVDGSHVLGAAALAEVLVERGVTFEDPGSRVYRRYGSVRRNC